MEENKVLEIENQVEVIDENQVPAVVEVAEAPIEVVDDETEKPAIPGVVLGAGVVLGGIALYKGVKAGINLSRKALQGAREKLDNWHLERADAIMAARMAEELSEEPEKSEDIDSNEESEK